MYRIIFGSEKDLLFAEKMLGSWFDGMPSTSGISRGRLALTVRGMDFDTMSNFLSIFDKKNLHINGFSVVG